MGVDGIDASIILGTIFEEEENCSFYLRNLGYKLHNTGILTVPLIGEIFANLFLKVSERIKDPSERKALIQHAVDFFDESIIHLLQEERLVIVSLRKEDLHYFSRIKEIDYDISDSDAFHVSCAIASHCQRFVTLDKKLLKDSFRSTMTKEFSLVITSP